MGEVTVIEAQQQGREEVQQLLPELPEYVEAELRNLSDDSNIKGSWKARILTAGEKAAACRTYAKTGSLIQAAQKIGGTPALLYGHLERDLEFRRAFQLAKLTIGDKIQATSVKRALTDGGVVDRMCQLKRFFPKVYKDSAPQVNVGVQLNLAPPPPA